MLIAGVAAAVAVATVLEFLNGREYARWYVYKSPWFAALLGLLALNVLAALIAGFPWRRGRRWLLLIHAGLLALSAGAIATFMAGVEGQLALVEGESTDRTACRRSQPVYDRLAQEREPAPLGVHLRAGTGQLGGRQDFEAG